MHFENIDTLKIRPERTYRKILLFKMTESPKKVKKVVKKAPAAHPKYIDMIVTSVETLKERGGSSRQAITKYIKANYNVGDNPGPHIKMALKRGVAGGKLLQPKGTGASGSFKAVPAKKAVAKKPAAKKPAAKKPAAKKPASKKATTPAKKKAPAKKAAKKTPAKRKPAAKKPAAKKVKKTPKKKTAAKKTAKK